MSYSASATAVASPEDDLITEVEARRLAGGSKPISFKTIRAWVERGEWPQPIRMGARTVRYSRAECVAAIDQRKAARRVPPPSTN